MTLLKIENLHLSIGDRKILNGVNLEIKKGEAQALLGPNASGKSTLANVIIGLPNYKIQKGKIFFERKEINKLSPEKRSKLGIAMAWQFPPKIKGVKLFQLLNKISKVKLENPIRKGRGFSNGVNKKIGLDSSLLEKEINVGFSGGEKKISELLQVISLNSKLVIFDEIDSGLDIKKLENTSKIIKQEFINKGKAVLLITHSGSILEYLKPKITNVMLDGKIICKEKNFKKVLQTIKKYGYEKCKKCSTC